MNASVLELPRLIHGSSSLGNLYVELNRQQKQSLVRGWISVSGDNTCIDCAGKYGAGLALQEIGQALRSLEIDPGTITISNKLGWKQIPLSGKEPTFEPGVWKNIGHDAAQSISYEGILECYHQGNELLGAPYSAALVSVHDPDEYLASAKDDEDRGKRIQDILDAYCALSELRDSGEVRAVGIGSKDWRVIHELSKEVDFDWVMFANSFTVYSHPRELADFITQLHSRSVYVINSAVFHAGFLVGGEFFDYRPVNEQQRPELFTWRTRFHEICGQFGVQPADACIEFGLMLPGISSVSLNTARPERIAKNARSVRTRAGKEFWEIMRSEGLINLSPGDFA